MRSLLTIALLIGLICPTGDSWLTLVSQDDCPEKAEISRPEPGGQPQIHTVHIARCCLSQKPCDSLSLFTCVVAAFIGSISDEMPRSADRFVKPTAQLLCMRLQV